MQTIEKIGKAKKRTHERRFSNRFDLIQTDGTKEKLSFTKNISKFRRSSLDVIFIRFCCCCCYWIVNRHSRILIYPFRINKANSNGQQTAERMGGKIEMIIRCGVWINKFRWLSLVYLYQCGVLANVRSTFYFDMWLMWLWFHSIWSISTNQKKQKRTNHPRVPITSVSKWYIQNVEKLLLVHWPGFRCTLLTK